jgi:hypothetical protein
VREQREIARLAPRGLYREIDSPHGHDAFLIETAQLGRHLAWFLAAESFDECSDERYDCTGAASAQHTSRTLTRQVA